jgi:oligopeptide transport system substrate-binding protein
VLNSFFNEKCFLKKEKEKNLRRIKHHLGNSLVFFLILFLVSCSSSEENKVVNLNFHSEPSNLDPRNSYDSVTGTFAQMLFEGLVRVDSETHKAVMATARKYEVSEDGKTYTFSLRKSYWTNGDIVSAKDFEYAWKKMLNPSFQSQLSYQLFPINGARGAKEGKLSLNDVGVKALDEYTLKVDLEYPLPYFIELLSSPAFFPVNRNVEQKNPRWASSYNRDFISNGPFALKAWKPGESIDVIKNPKYWDSRSVFLKGIKIGLIKDEKKELALYEDDKLDWLGAPVSSLPTDYFEKLKDRKDFQSYPISAAYWYMFNTQRPPFNNLKIRKALSYGLNRGKLLESLKHSKHLPATGIVPPTEKHPFKKSFFVDGNTALAKKLFEEGMKEEKWTENSFPEIFITINASADHEELARLVRDQWENLFNISVSIESLEWKTYLEKLSKGDYQVGRFGWIASFDDAMNFLELFKYKTSINNHTFWEDRSFVELLNQASFETNWTHREKVLMKAEESLVKQMPLVPLYYYTNAYLKKEKLQDVYVSSVGFLDFKRAKKNS